MKSVLTVLLAVVLLATAGVQPTAAQTPLDPTTIPKFVNPLPMLGPTGLPVLMGNVPGTISICEFQTQVLPPPFGKTWVWGYQIGDTCDPDPGHSYLGPVVVAQRGTPTQLTFINRLGYTATSNVHAYTLSTDQTLHWADPLNAEENWCSEQAALGNLPIGYCLDNYMGPVPAAIHLHGGEVPPDLDGGPDSWFTSDGAIRGHGYYTREVAVLPMLPDPGFPPGALVKRWSDGLYYRNDYDVWTETAEIDRATYVYPNQQEAANIWFHDHVLGATRLNTYAGIAGAYVITDPAATNPDLGPVTNLVPLVIQDRMFDTTGGLLFPAAGINPEHPYWVPEFVGDTIVVNGKAWPTMTVEPKRYRFLFLNGSLARGYELFLLQPSVPRPNGKPTKEKLGPPIWVIGTDGGYLDAPVSVNPNSSTPGNPDKLVLLPGERYEVIVDFTGLEGKVVELRNTAATPYPFGAPVTPGLTDTIMQFRVAMQVTSPGVAYDPELYDPLDPTTRPRVSPIVPLAAIAAAPDVRRQLTFNEVMGDGGPLEVLLNNTMWSGEYINSVGALNPRPEFLTVDLNGVASYYSEVPAEGMTEVWEIINITADAHPLHLHLVQFQLLGRQALDALLCYDPVYQASFPLGVYQEAYGPPADYYTGINANGVQIAAPGVLGGNPDPTPCLLGPPMPPQPWETGWKDTVVVYPDQVTRIAVRWAPTDLPAVPFVGNQTTLGFPFDPNHGHGYVWHCHILDHEDNEMMRPTQVDTNTEFQGRTFTKGIDY